METFNADIHNEKIEKGYKRARFVWLIGVIALALSAVLLLAGIGKYFYAKSHVAHMDEIILSDKEVKTRKLAYLDMIGCYEFASNGESGYYIAYNEDYYYLAQMTDDVYDYIEAEYEKKGDGELDIYGWTVSIPSDVRRLAIDSFNEEFGEEVVNDDTFEDIFGDIALSVHERPKLFGLDGFMNVSGGYLVAAIFSLIVGMLEFFLGKNRRKSYADVLKDESQSVLREISRESTTWFDLPKVYLTDEHIISVDASLDVIPYSDVFWTYMTEHRTNGIHDYDFMNISTKDGRLIQFGRIGTLQDKGGARFDIYNQVMGRIREKNPEARLGYSKENHDAAYANQKRAKQEKKQRSK